MNLMTKELRPFHETVREALFATNDYAGIFFLLQTTFIPKGHDAIIAALDRRWGGCNSGVFVKERLEEVKASILEQKAETEAKTAREAAYAKEEP